MTNSPCAMLRTFRRPMTTARPRTRTARIRTSYATLIAWVTRSDSIRPVSPFMSGAGLLRRHGREGFYDRELCPVAPRQENVLRSVPFRHGHRPARGIERDSLRRSSKLFSSQRLRLGGHRGSKNERVVDSFRDRTLLRRPIAVLLVQLADKGLVLRQVDVGEVAEARI